MGSKRNTAQRRELVRALLGRGFSYSHMVAVVRKKFPVTEATITRDMRLIKSDVEYIPDLNLENIIAVTFKNFKELQLEYWEIVAEPDITNGDKLRALNSIQKLDIDRYVVLEKAGVITGGGPPIGDVGPPAGVSLVEIYDLLELIMEKSGPYIIDGKWSEFEIMFKQTVLDFGRGHPDDPDPIVDVKAEAVKDIIYLGPGEHIDDNLDINENSPVGISQGT